MTFSRDNHPGGNSDDGLFRSKPSWSVLSLTALNEAVRHARDLAYLQAEESRRVELQRRHDLQTRLNREASVARAERDRYRNAWENT